MQATTISISLCQAFAANLITQAYKNINEDSFWLELV
jgi:hypothetical protein